MKHSKSKSAQVCVHMPTITSGCHKLSVKVGISILLRSSFLHSNGKTLHFPLSYTKWFLQNFSVDLQLDVFPLCNHNRLPVTESLTSRVSDEVMMIKSATK